MRPPAMRQLPTVAFALLLTAACDSGRDGPAATVGTFGDVAVVVANGGEGEDRIASFVVDVRAITLERTTGAVVPVLPRPARIDLAGAGARGELVAAGAIEAGTYGRAVVQLDFAHAHAALAGASTPATVRDRDGNVLTSFVPLVLDLAHGALLSVRPGRATLLRFDLDLAQSLTVDAAANELRFVPVCTVEAVPAGGTDVVLTGVVQRVDAGANTFVVERRSIDGSVLGEVAVRTGGDTVFELDGLTRAGTAGSALLPAHLLQRVRVDGALAPDELTVNARTVASGAGVVGNGQADVTGVVVARTGGPGTDAMLLVQGRSRHGDGALAQLDALHTVHVAHARTRVLRADGAAAPGTDAINVGQRVHAFGELTGTVLDARGDTGTVRLEPTPFAGTVVGAPAGATLTLELVRLGGHVPGAMNFDVGGNVQADPAAFAVAAEVLPPEAVAGSRVRGGGWLAPVDAPGPDVLAIALAERETGPLLLRTAWTPPARNVLTADANGPGLTFGIRTAREALVTDGVTTSLLPPSAEVELLPAPGGFYNLVAGERHELHRSWPEFRQAVLQRAGSARVAGITAIGTRAAGTQRLTVRSATVIFD
jgi:hypothetical protein